MGTGTGGDGGKESGFLNTKRREIREGDVVMLYGGFGKVEAMIARRGEQIQSSFGALRHEFVIGQVFGACVSASRGQLRLLRPTPSLWTQALSHRTQIIYPADQGLILHLLETRPGWRVAEAGMGSAALSHSLARSIAPSGRLYAFDVDEGRLKSGREEMESHGLGDLLSAELRNVCSEGLGTDAVDLDGVFLDLPRPWEAVPAAKEAISSSRGGRFVSFSPCIEQVQATVAALSQAGFVETKTVELVPRAQRVGKLVWDDLRDELPQPSQIPPAKILKVESGEPVKAEPEEAEEEELNKVKESEERRKEELSTSMSWIFPYQQPTHTGYITSATLLPS